MLILEHEAMKKKHDENIIKEKPIKPTQKALFIPANNSKTGVFDILSNNEERGIIFETEADTLADAGAARKIDLFL